MRVGIVLNGRRSASKIAAPAQLAEAGGIRQLWLASGTPTKDHFVRLAVAATTTQTIHLGPVAISPFEAHPARLAVELLTLHELARGRAALVIGGGGDFAAALRVPLKQRVRAVAETPDITRAMARGSGHLPGPAVPGPRAILALDRHRAAAPLCRGQPATHAPDGRASG